MRYFILNSWAGETIWIHRESDRKEKYIGYVKLTAFTVVPDNWKEWKHWDDTAMIDQKCTKEITETEAFEYIL